MPLSRVALRLNAKGTTRRNFQGQQHLVTPTVAVQEMVLSTPRGPELLRADAIKNSVPNWNGTWLTMSHLPQLRNRSNIESQGIGFLWKAAFNKQNRSLNGEMWIDLSRVSNVQHADKAVQRLEGGEMVEVSTAYLTRLVDESGTHNGDEFERVQAEIDPDHLAVLREEHVGNCSIEDGCGAPRANREGWVGRTVHVRMNPKKQLNALDTPRREFDFDDTETTPWSDVDKTLSNAIEYLEQHTDVDLPDETDDLNWSDLPQAGRNEISQTSVLGDPNADTFDEGLVLPIINFNTNNLNGRGVRNAISRAPQLDGVSQQTSEAAQGVLRSLLEEHFTEEEQENILQQLRARLNSWFGEMSEYLGFEMDTGDKTENQIAPDDAGDFETAMQALNEYIFEFGADPMNHVRTFFEWLRTNSPATGNEMKKIRDAADTMLQSVEPSTLRRVSVERFMDFLVEQGVDDPRQTNKGRDAGHDSDTDPAEGGNNLMGLRKKLAQNADCPFGETELESFDDDQVQNLADQYGVTDDDEPGGDPDDGQDPTQANQDQPTLAPDVAQVLNNFEGNGQTLSDVLQAGLQTLNEQGMTRDTLVQKLAQNNAVPFSEQELQNKSLIELQKLDRMAAQNQGQGDYTLEGGGSVDPSQNDEDDEPMPGAPSVYRNENLKSGGDE